VKVGIKTLKSLKDGRALIEVGSIDETNLLSVNIRGRCGDELEVNAPKLWKARMIIRNIPHDITEENIEEIIPAQNPELSLKPREVAARFKFSTKTGAIHMEIEVGPEARKKLLQTKLKIGWLICNVGDYLVAKRCFRCSRYNHRHQDCRAEETCPLCAGDIH
jgi:rubrerythrin